MSEVNVKSHHVRLDITRGQKTIDKHLSKGGKCFVRIEGYIEPDHGGMDDGVSIEFIFNPCSVIAKLQPVKAEEE